MKDIIIIGAGGFARETAWLIEEINYTEAVWNLIGFYEEKDSDIKLLNGYKVINREEFLKYPDAFLVIAIGDPNIKKQVASRYANRTFATLIHPQISISGTNSIGPGSIICKGSILTTNICVGNHVIINLDCTVGHDAVLKDFVTILPSVNISGHVNIGECTSVGTGTQIIQEKNIGENTVIGAGSVVVRDISDSVIAVGIPAREIKKREVM
jgi:sugar O-acyltransferase (sialic acid O-acetyltransferase NeuD family)